MKNKKKVAKIKKIKILKLFFIIIISLIIFFFIFNFLFPLDKKKIFRENSIKIYDTKGKLLRVKLSKDGFYRFYISLDKVPKLLQNSILYFEDKYFYFHFGVNPISIFKAILYNFTSKRKIGASTLTMQVARMINREDRTLKNKIFEIFMAFQLEWYYSKKKIFEIYLNLAPYGGNIEGIYTASKIYFNKELEDLSIAQMAILSIIPKNPNKNRIDRAKNLYSKKLRILRILLKNKLISKEQFDRAFKEKIIQKKFKFPFYAPHFISHLKDKDLNLSSLDLALQKKVLKILKSHTKKLYDKGIRNSSAIIINNKNMKVKAYIGSDNFFNKKVFGQNNGVTMIRSPGSTLKPFIYAKALEKGYISPKMNIFDIPIYIKGYSPKNFNKKNFGIITAEESLQLSLNIPAILLNKLLKNDSLYELLKKANIKSLDKEKNYYGDSLVLGGFGISLLDLTHLYTSLANKGKLKNLGFYENFQTKIYKKLISEESAYLINNILSDSPRPKFTAFWESSKNAFKVAFKTGTSANSKDLYTIGVTPNFTIGIWLGNFEGKKTENLTGITTATKVLFEIFDSINQENKLLWFKKPKNIISQDICIDIIKFKECKEKIKDFTIKGVKLIEDCAYFRAEVLAYLIEKGEFSKNFDNHKCSKLWKNYKPVISGAYNGMKISSSFEETSLNLKCYNFTKDKNITWFINDREPINSISGKVEYFKFEYGIHKISCLNSMSKMKEINFKIER